MLVAYFDESGTHGQEARVTTVAGLVGDSLTWARLEYGWKKRLARDGITCFHAVQCEVGDGEFSRMSRDARKALSLDLAKLVVKESLVAVSAAVYRDDWDYAASHVMKAYYPSKYHFCLAMAVLQAHQVSERYGGGNHVAFVFARQDQYQDYAASIHQVFQQGKWTGVGSLSFAKPRCVFPLQAADLYAYENYRELVRQLDNPGEIAPAREQLAIIYKGIPVEGKFGGINFLHAYAEGVDGIPASRSGTPGS
ncbi:DUF3800 domain-containing protein [Ramlibacter sp. G-1-2-2]|uniref:DUF3800 domain-containing protein n=1 Tax=Ramlibacter agri TaxID=2728837 RepID=A0A848H4L7_9BURK|nr:hypothetical protein [Ramlibacter agri]NML45936.1 DUF3800 domain-containing protein [Ramlibacter agri]